MIWLKTCPRCGLGDLALAEDNDSFCLQCCYIARAVAAPAVVAPRNVDFAPPAGVGVVHTGRNNAGVVGETVWADEIVGRKVDVVPGAGAVDVIERPRADNGG